MYGMVANSVKVLASKVEDYAELNENKILFSKCVEIIYHQSKPILIGKIKT